MDIDTRWDGNFDCQLTRRSPFMFRSYFRQISLFKIAFKKVPKKYKKNEPLNITLKSGTKNINFKKSYLI